ncbi:MAG: hypothetical protein J7L51_00975 [Desulfurococcales archaeon]|nr:hypothetical protein [Desulfurococcales archaeon]
MSLAEDTKDVETSRKDIEALAKALIDIYYIILSLGVIVYETTKITAKGHKITLPSDFIKHALLIKRISKTLEEIIWRVLYSPSLVLIEETRLSDIPEGRLDIPLTSRLRAQGLSMIATKRRRLSMESIENIFLKSFLKRLDIDISSALSKLSNFAGDDIIYDTLLKEFTKDFKESLLTLRRHIRKIIEKSFLKNVRVSRHFVSYSTIKRIAYRVLERGVYPYNKIAQLALEYLRENTLTLLSKYEANAEVLRDLKLRLWDYKLYEVYVFYVMTYAILQELLKEKSAPLTAGLYSDEALITVNLGSKIKILYDRGIPCSSWISHGKYSVFNGNEISIPSGRPDIAIQISSSVIAVCDAKYRVSAAELSEARFKVLGYMHEYSAPIGILIFDPQHLMYKEVLDEEVREDIELMGKIRKYRGVLIENKNKSLYIVALSPVRHTELMETQEYRILKDLCAKLIHYLR